MAHARRKLVDALKARKKSGGPPAQIIKFFDRLRRIERQVRDEKPDDGETRELYMRRFRQKHSVPVLSALKQWLDKISPNVMPGGRFLYAQPMGLSDPLIPDDSRMPIDNNLLERVIRIFATERKGWVFSDTVQGVKAVPSSTV